MTTFESRSVEIPPQFYCYPSEKSSNHILLLRLINCTHVACFDKALRSLDAKKAVAVTDGMLTQWNVEGELFRGCRLSEKSNRKELDAFAEELVKEHERQVRNPRLPVVVTKPAIATSRSSSTTTATGRSTGSMMSLPAS